MEEGESTVNKSNESQNDADTILSNSVSDTNTTVFVKEEGSASAIPVEHSWKTTDALNEEEEEINIDLSDKENIDNEQHEVQKMNTDTPKEDAQHASQETISVIKEKENIETDATVENVLKKAHHIHESEFKELHKTHATVL